MKNLIDACLGLSPLDMLIYGQIADVYGRSIFNGYIGIKDGLIAYVGSKPKLSREMLDLQPKYILPAYIDGHTHIESSLMTPSMFTKAVIPHGTCCVVADPHEIANVLGLDGIRFIIEDAEEIARRTEALEEEASRLGCKIKNPFIALSFLSLPVVPKLKITDYGLIDAERLKIVSPFID